MTLKAVIFDAGNTLMLVNYGVVVEALGAEGWDVEEAAVREAEYRARVRLDQVLARRHSTEAPEIFRTYMRFVCEEIDVPWDEAAERALGRIAAYHRVHNLWDRLNPQAQTVLEMLRDRGLTLGMISNSNGWVERLVMENGLRPYFHFVLDSRLIGVEKPDPRIFQIALDRLGIDPAEALYIGDLYSIDVVGSRAAGMRAILLDPAGLWDHVDCPKARDLSEAADLILKQIGAGLPRPWAG
ncbi:HAD-superfamily hydrolase, subfamily IA, variant 3 [Candidatus Methylomirabilis lanthanidiphila]|uniref:HAD-superfamily hydrolase, subfamily IA, variant 3 n=1 Tax=Candidatus Methylomirabilis lanthanidiphila TaxID=2211376 RepID=A0A564ZKV0_9BACT|nr:HAD-IA family hydrolase [Candidatus Methylomirabilis lanthanidiphila]VUZ85178.1 HAD-superfamily hydrolase, subfamily IA, variant 3 [Candidatus Methylomirabilis lanthanidiphila]